MLIYLGFPGTIDPRDPRDQRGVRSYDPSDPRNPRDVNVPGLPGVPRDHRHPRDAYIPGVPRDTGRYWGGGGAGGDYGTMVTLPIFRALPLGFLEVRFSVAPARAYYTGVKFQFIGSICVSFFQFLTKNSVRFQKTPFFSIFFNPMLIRQKV